MLPAATADRAPQALTQPRCRDLPEALVHAPLPQSILLRSVQRRPPKTIHLLKSSGGQR